jgi:PAS domain S-box-containing protein
MIEEPATRLLLVEDNLVRLLREMFAEPGSPAIDLAHVESMGEAEEYLASHAIDAILLDLGLPDAQGLAAVRRVRAAAPRTPVVVLTGMSDESLAVQALREGAQDYLVKGQIEARGLLRATRYAIERMAADEAIYLEKERALVTLDSIGDAVISTDVSGTICLSNLVAQRLTGWPSQDAVGRPVAEVLRLRDDAGLDPLKGLMTQAFTKGRTVHLPSGCVLLQRGGTEIPIDDVVSPIHDRDGRISGVVIVFRDVTAASEMALRMAHSAQHDFLTGS